MKPWLNEILACPMDKHYPLKLFVFEYETKSEEFDRIIKIYSERNIEKIQEENLILISKNASNNVVQIKDNIVIKPTPVPEYLHRIIQSIEELKDFYDKTSELIGKKCLEIVQSTVKNNISHYLDHGTSKSFDNILPELYILNKLKLDVEISLGLLFCEECCRFYPIVDTIPKMLPDEFRNEQEDLEFLSQAVKKNYIQEDFLKGLKPFTL
ncbi:MAG: hypothetical protein JW891_15450 [Candidatus Lokiarchaeota archaeon]|nr:hypothetical protein [Candidatus Lokiarchaeota archaeon]